MNVPDEGAQAYLAEHLAFWVLRIGNPIGIHDNCVARMNSSFSAFEAGFLEHSNHETAVVFQLPRQAIGGNNPWWRVAPGGPHKFTRFDVEDSIKQGHVGLRGALRKQYPVNSG